MGTNDALPTTPTELSLDDMLAAPDVEYRKVDMPEWDKGGKKATIYLGTVSVAEVMAVQQEEDPEKKKVAGIRLLVSSLVNREAYEGKPGGARVGTEAHVEMFKQKRYKSIEKLLAEVMDLNGMNAKPQQAVLDAKKD